MLRFNEMGASPHPTSNHRQHWRGAAPMTLLAATVALVLGACSLPPEQASSDTPLLSQSSPLAIAPRWSTPASMASARNRHTTTLLPSGKVLAVGGEGPSGPLASAELLDLATGSWISAGSLFEARKNHTATLLPSGKVLVAGGEGPGGSLGSAELFDPATGSWATAGLLSEGRKNHTATLLPSGKVLVTGGSGSAGPMASAELYDPATGSWTSAGWLTQARASSTATLLPSGKVLVVGGEDSSGSLASAELYDPVTDSWSSAGSLALSRKDAIALLLPSGKVLVAGGSDSTGPMASAELYDPATGSWTATGSLGQARTDTTATLLTSGKVLVVGGTGTYDALASAELYDPATGSWAATLAPSLVRRSHTATLLPSGKVLVVGGLGSSVPLASTELYNPSTSSWTFTPPFVPGRSHTATLLPSGKVLVTSGANDNGFLYVVSVKEYDPISGTWAATGPLGQGRFSDTATLLLSGKVLVAGGSNSSTYLASAELYDPASRSWTPTGPMTQARRSHTATLLPSGKVLVVGGAGSSGALASAELYDPATGSWAATGSLSRARYSHTATLLPSGKVLVAGGYASGLLSGAELYDPATGTWSATGPLAQARELHTATLLPSGKVLVAGGEGSSYYTASAEVYDPVTGSWTATGSLTSARFGHTATLLPSGKVLVANGAEASSYGPTSELYDPATGSWTPATPPGRTRYYHTATLLPSGKVLVTGGDSYDFSCEVYDDTGANPSWRPGILSVSASAPLAPGSVFTVNGSLLRGLSEGSSGGSRSSPTDFPFLTLLDMERGRLVALPAQDFSSTHVTASVPQVPPGQYLLSVTVNGLSSTTVLAIAAGPDTTPPTVTLTAPASGATLAGTVTLSATALDDFAVNRVEFYDGNVLLGADTAPPYSLSWNTRTTANGPHLITVTAFDAVGQSASSPGASVTVNNDLIPPSVAISSPMAGTTVTGTLTATATATDNLGVTRIEFYDGATLLCTDTSAPYTCSWSTRTGPNGDRTLTAKAYDAAGNTGVTTVTVTANNDLTPPTVALTAPTAGETVSGTVVFTATASDEAGISQVAFFVGSLQVGIATSAPYSLSYDTRNLSNGTWSVTARATDTSTNVTTSAPVSVTFNNDLTPPTVALTAPAAGATLVGTVALSATAADNIAVARVEFYDGNTLLGTVTSAPYGISWDSRTVANGAHVLTAKAYDTVGQSTTSSGVSVTVYNDEVPPTVTFSAPSAGATVLGTLTLTAIATDNVAVTRVEFYDGNTLLGTDTVSPYTYSWNTLTAPNGEHTLTAKAYDAKENLGTFEVAVTVDNDLTPPTVALTAPSEGATVSGTVVLSATASDNKAVTRVAFFIGSTQVGTDTTTPFSLSYNSRLQPNGTKVLTVKAYDAANNVATSAPVNVTFDNDFTPPTVTLTAPAEGETLSGTVTLTASASDPSGISKVAFFVGTTQVGTDTTAPFSLSYNSRLQSNGTKVLTAKAYDAANNVATSAPVNVTFDNDFTPPTVTLTAPAEGETLSGTVTLTASASDSSGISKVTFFVGITPIGTALTAPYSLTYNTRTLTNGAKTITAKAYDALNNMATSAAVNVTVDNDFTAPTTSLISPTGGSTVSGVVQLDAIASDDRGTVAKVDFYQGSLLLGTVTTAPYSWTWDTTKAPLGANTLKTRAWDAAGNSAYSPNVTVTVTR